MLFNLFWWTKLRFNYVCHLKIRATEKVKYIWKIHSYHLACNILIRTCLYKIFVLLNISVKVFGSKTINECNFGNLICWQMFYYTLKRESTHVKYNLSISLVSYYVRIHVIQLERNHGIGLFAVIDKCATISSHAPFTQRLC